LYDADMSGGSFLHRLDPRTKLLLTALFTILVFIVDTLLPAAVQMLLFFSLCLAARIPVKKIFPHAKMLLFIIILVILLQTLFGKDGGRYFFGFLKMDGLLTGLMVSCRIISVCVLMPVLTLTTETRYLTFGISRLGINYRYAYIITSALNLIPMFKDEAQLMIEARKLRGMKSLDAGNTITRMKEYSALVIPLIIKAIRQAGLMGLTMDSRAFGTHKTRTWLLASRFRTRDYAAFAAGIAYSAIAITVNIILKR
jgi:energy-coupling factor transport system permease protein